MSSQRSKEPAGDAGWEAEVEASASLSAFPEHADDDDGHEQHSHNYHQGSQQQQQQQQEEEEDDADQTLVSFTVALSKDREAAQAAAAAASSSGSLLARRGRGEREREHGDRKVFHLPGPSSAASSPHRMEPKVVFKQVLDTGVTAAPHHRNARPGSGKAGKRLTPFVAYQLRIGSEVPQYLVDEGGATAAARLRSEVHQARAAASVTWQSSLNPDQRARKSRRSSSASKLRQRPRSATNTRARGRGRSSRATTAGAAGGNGYGSGSASAKHSVGRSRHAASSNAIARPHQRHPHPLAQAHAYAHHHPQAQSQEQFSDFNFAGGYEALEQQTQHLSDAQLAQQHMEQQAAYHSYSRQQQHQQHQQQRHQRPHTGHSGHHGHHGHAAWQAPEKQRKNSSQRRARSAERKLARIFRPRRESVPIEVTWEPLRLNEMSNNHATRVASPTHGKKDSEDVILVPGQRHKRPDTPPQVPLPTSPVTVAVSLKDAHAPPPTSPTAASPPKQQFINRRPKPLPTSPVADQVPSEPLTVPSGPAVPSKMWSNQAADSASFSPIARRSPAPTLQAAPTAVESKQREEPKQREETKEENKEEYKQAERKEPAPVRSKQEVSPALAPAPAQATPAPAATPVVVEAKETVVDAKAEVVQPQQPPQKQVVIVEPAAPVESQQQQQQQQRQQQQQQQQLVQQQQAKPAQPNDPQDATSRRQPQQGLPEQHPAQAQQQQQRLPAAVAEKPPSQAASEAKEAPAAVPVAAARPPAHPASHSASHHSMSSQHSAAGRRSSVTHEAALEYHAPSFDGAGEEKQADPNRRLTKREIHAQIAARNREVANERRRRRLARQARREEAANKEIERMAALMSQKGNQLVSLLLTKHRVCEAKLLLALRRARKRIALRKKQEAERAQKEIAGMQAAEWDAARVEWFGSLKMRQSTWSTVRVFISSTFNDMHGERDSLTRHVFPLLNERCRARRVRVIPVDLRWGLTKEDTSDEGLGALEHCLLEIDHCRPFFMVLAGERYGWIPPGYRVSDAPQFEWVKTWTPNHSITAMEIFYGFLRRWSQPCHALLYRRDPTFMQDITDPGEHRVFAFDYKDDEVVAKRRQDLLDDMEGHNYCKTRWYPCTYGGKDKAGKPHTAGLQQFERMVLEDLYKAVCFEFPPAPPPLTSLEEEVQTHRAFASKAIRGFVGCHAQLDELAAHFHHCKKHRDFSLPLLLVGDSGSGKTTVMAKYIDSAFESHRKDMYALPHFVGCSPESQDVREMLRRVWKELAVEYAISTTGVDADYPKLREKFAEALQEAGAAAIAKKQTIFIALDGVDQLHRSYDAHSCDWLPRSIPPGVCMVVCVCPEVEAFGSLIGRKPEPPIVDMEGLSPAEAAQLVQDHLQVYRKRLTQSQLDQILRKGEASKPVYLATVCEELRLQAQYGIDGAGVDSKIEEMPDGISPLLNVVIARLEEDLTRWASTVWVTKDHLTETAQKTDESGMATLGTFVAASSHARMEPTRTTHHADKTTGLDMTTEDFGSALVRNAMTLLACSRYGLTEVELLELLAPRGSSQLPALVWARFFRTVEAYITPPGSGEHEGVIGFFHRQMAQAVHDRYLGHDHYEKRDVYTRLAAYFRTKADPQGNGSWSGVGSRVFEDLVFYQLRALQLVELHDTLGNLNFVRTRASMGPASFERLMRDYHDALEVVGTAKYARIKAQLKASNTSRGAFIQWLTEFMTFVATHSSKMVQFPHLTYELALNCPDGSAPNLAALRLLAQQAVLYNHQLQKHAEDVRRGYESAVYRANKAATTTDLGSVCLSPDEAANHVQRVYRGKRGRASADKARLTAIQKQYAGGAEADTVAAQIERLAKEEAEKAKKKHHKKKKGRGAKRGKPKMLRSETQRGFVYEVPAECSVAGSLWVAPAVSASMVPPTWLEWINKPQTSRILSETNYSAEITCMDCGVHGSAEIAVFGFVAGDVMVVDIRTGKILKDWRGVHKAEVASVSLSNDGKRILSGGVDAYINVWDTSSGAQLEHCSAHECPITVVQFIRSALEEDDGSTPSLYFATASLDSTVTLWEEVENGAKCTYICVWVKDWLASPIHSMAVCEADNLLYTGRGDGTFEVWDCHALTLGLVSLDRLEAVSFASINAIDVSKDGNQICLGTSDGDIKLWHRVRETDAASGLQFEEVQLDGQGHSKPVASVQFTPSGGQIVTCGADKCVSIWDTEQLMQGLVLRGHAMAVTGAMYLPQDDKKVVSVSADMSMVKWDVGAIDFTAVHVRAGSNDTDAPFQVLCSAVSPDYSDGTVITGSRNAEVSVWNAHTGRLRKNLLGHTAAVTAACFSHDGTFMATGDAEGRVIVWSAVQLTKLSECINKHPITCLALHYKGAHGVLFTGDSHGCLRYWNAVNGKAHKRQPDAPADGSGPILSLQFTPSSNTATPATSLPRSAPITLSTLARAPSGAQEVGDVVVGFAPAYQADRVTCMRRLEGTSIVILESLDAKTGDVLHDEFTDVATISEDRCLMAVAPDGCRVAVGGCGFVVTPAANLSAQRLADAKFEDSSEALPSSISGGSHQDAEADAEEVEKAEKERAAAEKAAAKASRAGAGAGAGAGHGGAHHGHSKSSGDAMKRKAKRKLQRTNSMHPQRRRTHSKAASSHNASTASAATEKRRRRKKKKSAHDSSDSDDEEKMKQEAGEKDGSNSKPTLEQAKEQLKVNDIQFSNDGAYIVAAIAGEGLPEGVRGQVIVLDASRPHDGSVAEFVSPTEVTSVAAGMSRPQFNVQDGVAHIHGHEDMLFDDHLKDSVDVSDRSDGGILHVVAGDKDGNVMLLQLTDVLRLAYNLKGRISEEHEAMVEEVQDMSEPATFGDPVSVATAGNTIKCSELSRTLAEEQVPDLQVAERLLKSMGLDVAGMKQNFAKCAREASVNGAAAIHNMDVLTRDEALSALGQETDAALAKPRLPVVSSPTARRRSVGRPGSARRKGRRRSVSKPGSTKNAKKKAQAEAAQKAMLPAKLMAPLKECYTKPRMAAILVGATHATTGASAHSLQNLLQRGLAPAVLASGGMLLDNGVATGCVGIVGSALAKRPAETARLVGICPRGAVNIGKTAHAGLPTLEPNHDNVCVVEGKVWGIERGTLVSMLKAFHAQVPCIMILLGGGGPAKAQLLSAVALGIPIIVVSGSGRLADELLRHTNARRTDPFWSQDSIADHEVRQIVAKAHLHFYALSAKPQGLQTLMWQLAGQQRQLLLGLKPTHPVIVEGPAEHAAAVKLQAAVRGRLARAGAKTANMARVAVSKKSSKQSMRRRSSAARIAAAEGAGAGAGAGAT